jgi:hypothetical protein
LAFTTFETAATAGAFNATCAEGDMVDTVNGAGYAITELTSNGLVGIMDPTSVPRTDQQMEANSSLFFWERKVIEREHAPTTRLPNDYRVRLLKISSIAGPVAAFQDFSPNFDHKTGATMTCGPWVNRLRLGAFIFVRPRDQWGQVFLAKARRAFRQYRGEQNAEQTLGKKVGSRKKQKLPAMHAEVTAGYKRKAK